MEVSVKRGFSADTRCAGRRRSVALLMLVAAVAGCKFLGVDAMATPTQPGAGPQTATIRLPSGDVRLSAADARQIGDALKHYLQTSPNVSKVPMLTPDSGAWLRPLDEGAIDPQGNVRVGPWLLQERGGKLVLVYREPPAGKQIGYQYIAPLERKEQRWYVAELNWEKIFYR
jgi:hypothetical protein